MDKKMEESMGHMEERIGHKMEANMQRLVKLLQNLEEKLPYGDDVDRGTHEDKGCVHVEQPFISKNVPRGFDSKNGNHHGWSPRSIQLPKIDMRKFDGKGPITWIFRMDQFFDIHQVPNLQKVTFASLYLEPQQFVWYQWLCEHKKKTIISWSIFTEELISYHDDVKSNTQLINLRQRVQILSTFDSFKS
jgi:hypothetical protein